MCWIFSQVSFWPRLCGVCSPMFGSLLFWTGTPLDRLVSVLSEHWRSEWELRSEHWPDSFFYFDYSLVIKWAQFGLFSSIKYIFIPPKTPIFRLISGRLLLHSCSSLCWFYTPGLRITTGGVLERRLLSWWVVHSTICILHSRNRTDQEILVHDWIITIHVIVT